MPMIWIEKYKPKTFNVLASHKEISSMLACYNLESVPNLIFHGQTGHNKKTMVYCLIEHLYGKYPDLKQKTIEMDLGSTKLSVNYLESEEVIELCPSDYGIRDRYVSQHLIKEMAQTRPILSMLGSKRRSIKILIIDQAENLSRDAQAALRRTMEVYSSHLKVIMVCTEISKLIDPIRSRCLMIRMRGFEVEETKLIMDNILQKENRMSDASLIEDIAEKSEGNLKKDLCLLEIMCFNSNNDEGKRFKPNASALKLEWETKIDQMADKIKNNPKIENLSILRKELYELLNSCIPPNIILLELTRRFSSCPLQLMREIVSTALIFDERLRIGTKALYHIEAFIATTMCIFSQRKK